MRESPGGLSMLKTYMLCPRKWALKYLIGWTSKEKLHPSLIIGSSLHEAIAVFIETRDINTATEKLLSTLHAMCYSGERTDTTVLEARALQVFHTWLDAWGPERFFDEYKVVAVEKQYDLALANGFNVTLRVDRILEKLETEHLHIHDTKFTGWSISKTEFNYMSNPQPLLYHAVPYFIDTDMYDKFRGWITDIVYQRGSKCTQYTSEPVFYDKSEVQAYLDSLTTVTDDIAYSVKQALEHPEHVDAMFPAYRGDACNFMNSPCPFQHYCLRRLSIGAKVPDGLVSEDKEFTGQVVDSFLALKD